jgi:hypothetical protein
LNALLRHAPAVEFADWIFQSQAKAGAGCFYRLTKPNLNKARPECLFGLAAGGDTAGQRVCGPSRLAFYWIRLRDFNASGCSGGSASSCSW